MKEKWINLSWPHRIVILLQAFLILLFLILYCTIGKQQIISYRGEHLRFHGEHETSVYSGKINGNLVEFSVRGNSLEYRSNNVLIDTYTLTEDPSFSPSDMSPGFFTGIEIHNKDGLLFRGYYHTGHPDFLYNEQKEPDHSFIVITSGARDNTPNTSEIIRLLKDPDVSQRGPLGIWFLVSLLCLINAISVLFADKLFRWNLRFSIRNVEQAEPSEWELFSRWIGWTMISIVALILYIVGLNLH